MTLEYITSLIATGESETLEFKQTTGRRREATQTVCAMLNHRGGYVLFGVTPGGKVTGQQVSDRTVEAVSREIQQLDPPAFPAIERVLVEEGREVIVVSVSQSQMKPYSYRGVAYRRVGNTNLTMSRDEYNQRIEAELPVFAALIARIFSITDSFAAMLSHCLQEQSVL